MESKTIAALLFIVVIVGINFVMYGIVRVFMTSGQKGRSMLETLSKSLAPNVKNKDEEFQELRKKIEELEKGGQE